MCKGLLNFWEREYHQESDIIMPTSITMDNLIKRAQTRLDEFRALPTEEKKRVALEHLISIGVLLPDGSKNPEFYPPVYPEFARWPSIQRLSSETCYISEKIDGTCAVIYVPTDPSEPILAGSRERWLSNVDGTPPAKVKDNFGFGAWVYERRDNLRRLGPGMHYGEFHGAGIQRGYGLTYRRFASFEYWRDDIHIPDVCVVPLLYTGEPTPMCIDNAVSDLRAGGSVLYPGFMKPEGVVITYKNMSSCKFKRLCENDKLHKFQQGAPCPKTNKPN